MVGQEENQPRHGGERAGAQGAEPVREEAVAGIDLECEEMLGVAWDAYLATTGQEMPEHSFTIDYPALDPEWDFSFDDAERVALRLPKLDALYT